MKKINYFFVFLFLFGCLNINVYAAEEVKDLFPDDNFYNCIIKDDNVKSIEDLSSIKSINCGDESKPYDTKITSTKGIEYLTELTEINLYQNNIKTIDLSKNTKLRKIQLGYNQLSEINLSSNINLEELALSGNQLYSIDLSKNVKLTSLYLHRNNLYEINLQNNKNLVFLQIGENHIENIDVSQLTNLTFLDVSGNNITTIDLSSNLKLDELDISNNNINKIVFSDSIRLKNANFVNNQLDSNYKLCFNAKKCNYGNLLTVTLNKSKIFYNLEKNSNIFNRINNLEYLITTDSLIEVSNESVINNQLILYTIIVLLLMSIFVNIILIIKCKKERK